MRRPALLAFGLFAIVASLPAEVRECLPMSNACARRTACERPTRSCGTSCARPAALAKAAARPVSCPLARRAAATRAGCLPDLGNCRLHPTPPGTPVQPALSLDAPSLTILIEPIAEVEVAGASRAGWIEPQVPRPRPAPRAAPFSPRPPPLAV